MSCRLIRDTKPQALQPLFAAEPRQGTPQPWLQEETPEPVVVDTAELDQLRQQVRDLEAALQRRAEEGRQAGLREGEAAGYERGVAAGKPVVEKLGRTITEIGGLRNRIRHETEQELVTLSVAIARRVLRRELTIDPDSIKGLIRAALDKIQARDLTTVRIHAGHEAALRQCLNMYGGPGIEVIPDPAMQVGEVVFETKRGNLEASIETQLAEIERGFADRIG